MLHERHVGLVLSVLHPTDLADVGAGGQGVGNGSRIEKRHGVSAPAQFDRGGDTEDPGADDEHALVFALLLPWFKKAYISSTVYIFGAELLFSFYNINGRVGLFTGLTITFILAVPVITLLFSKKKLSADVSILGFILISVMLYQIPVPAGNLSIGVLLIYAGLIMIIAGGYKNG